MDSQTLRESVTGAIRYWEPRRLLYNAVLAAIVLIFFGIYYPTSKSFLSVDSVLGLFLLVVFGKRRVLRSISGGHLCLCVQLS